MGTGSSSNGSCSRSRTSSCYPSYRTLSNCIGSRAPATAAAAAAAAAGARMKTPPAADDRNQLAACLASISDMALTGEPASTSQSTLAGIAEQTAAAESSTSSRDQLTGTGSGFRRRLKQRLRRARSSADGGSGSDGYGTGDCSLDDETVRTHIQLLDSLDSQDDDSHDWAAMRSWLVWCLRDKLGDAELHMFDGGGEDCRHRLRQMTSAAGFKGRLKTSGLGTAGRCQSRLSKSVEYSRSSRSNTTDYDDNDCFNNFSHVYDAVSGDVDVELPGFAHPVSKSADCDPLSTHIPSLSSRSALRANTSTGGPPRLVRQLAVQERSPRASFVRGVSAPDGQDRCTDAVVELEGAAKTATRNLRLKPPPRRRRDGHQTAVDTSFIGLSPLGSTGTGHQLTVNDASYSAGSSFESSGSAG